MTQYGFYFDASKCTGCKTCMVACKDKNNLPVGMNFRRVTEFSGGNWRQDRATGAWHQDVLPLDLLQRVLRPRVREGVSDEGALQARRRRSRSHRSEEVHRVRRLPRGLPLRCAAA
jgi:ferredoxin